VESESESVLLLLLRLESGRASAVLLLLLLQQAAWVMQEATPFEGVWRSLWVAFWAAWLRCHSKLALRYCCAISKW
jgi:hypothetical protein